MRNRLAGRVQAADDQPVAACTEEGLRQRVELVRVVAEIVAAETALPLVKSMGAVKVSAKLAEATRARAAAVTIFVSVIE